MKENKYFPATLGAGDFHCPHCGVHAKQYWAHLSTLTSFQWSSHVDKNETFNEHFGMDWSVSKCNHCSKKVFWYKSSMVYPRTRITPEPNEDLGPEIIQDYLEASNVIAESPRSAAALLRLALQKLCRRLGEPGENINDDIKSLVKKGLNPLVQKSLDALRITGNNAVHPGEIDLEEEPERVIKLFSLLNFIAEKLITEPKEISGFYESLPEKAKAAVEKRDKG